MLRNSKTVGRELNRQKRVLQYAAEFLAKNTSHLPENYPTKDVKDWFVKNYEGSSSIDATWSTSSNYNGHFWRSRKPLIR